MSDPASGVEPYPLGGAQVAGQTPQSEQVYSVYTEGQKAGLTPRIWGSTPQSDHRVNTVIEKSSFCFDWDKSCQVLALAVWPKNAGLLWWGWSNNAHSWQTCDITLHHFSAITSVLLCCGKIMLCFMVGRGWWKCGFSVLMARKWHKMTKINGQNLVKMQFVQECIYLKCKYQDHILQTKERRRSDMNFVIDFFFFFFFWGGEEEWWERGCTVEGKHLKLEQTRKNLKGE